MQRFLLSTFALHLCKVLGLSCRRLKFRLKVLFLNDSTSCETNQLDVRCGYFIFSEQSGSLGGIKSQDTNPKARIANVLKSDGITTKKVIFKLSRHLPIILFLHHTENCIYSLHRFNISPKRLKTTFDSIARNNLLPTCCYHLCSPWVLHTRQKRNNRARILVLLFLWLPLISLLPHYDCISLVVAYLP